MLTIFVIPCDNPEESDIKRLKESFGDMEDVDLQVLDHRDLNVMDKGTNPWYGYLFSNEWLDDGLQFALPYFLREDSYDYLVLFKKVIEDKAGITEPRVFQMPRIFRSHIELEGPGSLLPINSEHLDFTKVLDGWVMEPTRKIQ